MIELYIPTNTNFEQNGDVVLEPTSCLFDTKNQELTLEHPIDELGKWKYIQDGAVIKAPCDNGIQKFRLFKRVKTDSGVSITGTPIFISDARGVWVNDIRVVDLSGQSALNKLLSGTKFKAKSDIIENHTAYFIGMNLLNAICGDDENTFLSRWGGEIVYDNETVIINKQLGDDHGVELRYGKNIPLDGLEEETSQEEVCTRIIPQAYNGHQLPNGETVDSPLINKYPIVMNPQIIKYEDIKLKEDAQEDDEGIICDTLDELYKELRKAAAKEFSQNDIDKPKVNVKADIVLLSNTIEYKDHYSQLEKIHRGDIITCIHDVLDINTKARVVNLVWDCILDRPDTVEIGAEYVDYVAKTSSIIHSANQVIDTGTKTLIAEKVNGIINLMNAQMKAQKTSAQRQDVRAILFEDTDPNSEMFGALCLGTLGIQLAQERTEDGSDWDWGTAINYQSIIADYIITGILSDKEGKFYLNLDTGELVMKDAHFSGTVQGSTINGGTITGSNIKGGNIDVDTDVRVGNRIYLNKTKGIQSGIHLGEDGNKPRVIFNDDGNVKGVSIFPGSNNEPMIHVGTDHSIFSLKDLSITLDGETPYTGTKIAKNSIRVKNGFVMDIK